MPLLYETYAPATEWGTRVIGEKRVSISETAELESGEIYELETEYQFLPGIPPLTEWVIMQRLKNEDWAAKGVEPTYMRVEATWIGAKSLVQYRLLSSFSPIAVTTIIAIVAVAAAALGLAVVAYFAYRIIVKVGPPPEVSKYVWTAIGIAIPVFAVGYLLKGRRSEKY